MYECPNCGGNLKFDIASQQLACAYCNTKFDPYSVSKEKDAEEDNSYEVTVFTCPQCGGEIYSTDNTVAGFCSFCGASAILTSRLQRERRPGFIIPFRKTKEDCKKAYSKMLRFAIFAPKELKSAKHIDSFRGIYMPYWMYHIKQQGPISLNGIREQRKGDYILTDHYHLQADLDMDYKGMSYDASSSFADSISEKIAPFDIKKMKEFSPTFLSGFYADSSDVELDTYEEDAKDMAVTQTKEFLEKHPNMGKYQLEDAENELKDKFNTTTENVDSVMFPVWFLSYRNKNRVAYATVNGQTGKVVADLPVDIKKYLFGSLILAAVLFMLLNSLLTIKPAILLIIVLMLAMISIILHAVEMKKIAVKEGYEDDKGVQASLEKKRKDRMKKQAADTLEDLEMEPFVVTNEMVKSSQKKKKRTEYHTESHMESQKKMQNIIASIAIFVFLLSFIMIQAANTIMLDGRLVRIIIMVIIMLIAFISCKVSFSNAKWIEAKKGVPGSLWSALAIILGGVVIFWNPVSDIFYYAAVIISLIAEFFTLLDLIKSYNILATRRLPQFDYRGGDDRA